MMEELGSGSFVTPTVRLVRPLAQGGMGTVWVAEHLVLETNVVVKLMTKELAGNVDGAARFAREAAIAAAVKSPHVVQVFDSGVTDEGVAYIVMELLEGHDLGAHLTASGRMAPTEVANIVTQLAKALAKAHRVQVIHRDLKPENVYLCDVEEGEAFVKLLDFGTAKDEARAPFTTTAGQLLGTPYYMSPEQILGEEVDTRADIWSLGVLAFEALTGVRPFDGVTVGAITLAIHTTKPRPSDVVPELAPALDEWFARACARDPAERFPTVRAAGDAFARAATGDASIVDSSPDFVVESAPGAPPSFPGPARFATGPLRPAATPSERVATSLSSTLSSPRHERRRVQWIAGGVVSASVIGMLAFFAYDDPSPTAPAFPARVAATAPAASASALPTAASALAALPSSATASSVAHASATAAAAPSTTATATTAKPPTTLPFPHPPTSASSAPPVAAAPAVSALPPASASASALPPAPAPAPAPASASASAPTPSADPAPTAPIDLHDLLPSASPPP